LLASDTGLHVSAHGRPIEIAQPTVEELFQLLVSGTCSHGIESHPDGQSPSNSNTNAATIGYLCGAVAFMTLKGS
jgi:hypothetical protein